MELKITSKYPKNVVEDIVNLAHKWVFQNSISKPDFRVRVKNSEYAYAGRYYGYTRPKVVVRIGRPNHFPCKCKYPNRITAPEYMMNDWKEAMFCVSFHEFWHGLQDKTNSPYSEVETERMVVKFLEQFRQMRPELDAKWKAATDKVVQREQSKKLRAAAKNTPEYELQQIGKKIAAFTRRMKLYTTKLKKLNRRKRHLEKKSSEEKACLVATNP